MAKPKLTGEAIQFIIDKRNDRFDNFTYDDIAEMIQARFKIEITGQAVGLSYRQNKDKPEYSRDAEVRKKALSKKVDNVDELKSLKQAEPALNDVKNENGTLVAEPVLPVDSGTDFDDEAGKKYDAEDFFN